MKILFLTPWYPDENNSFHGIFVQDQVVAVRQRHEVLVISSKIDYTRFGLLSSDVSASEYQNVKEFRVRIKKSFLIFNQVNYFLLSVWHTLRITRSFKPDIIHGNIGYPGAFWAWCISKILAKPFVITEHTRITNNFRSSIHRLLTTFSMKRAAAVISVSKWQADEIFSLLSIRPVVIPNIVKADNFANVNPAIATKPVQFGFLGSMNTPVKGLDILLKAISSIRQDFIFHVGGDGVLSEKYKSLAKELGVFEKCVFYGTMQPDQVPAFMSRLHFFVNASRSETFGIAIAEAMAVGLPVVATNCGGPQDFVSKENGILVTTENVDELRSGIEHMIDHYTSYKSAVIREIVKNKFSATAILNEIDKIYKSIAL